MKKKRIFAFLLSFILMTGACGCSASAKSIVSPQRMNEMQAAGESYWSAHTVHETGEPVTTLEYIRPLSYILQYPKTGFPETDARIEAIVADIRNAFDQEYLPPVGPEGETRRDENKEATLYLAYETYLTDENHMSLFFFETHEVEMEMSPHTRIQAFHFNLKEDREVAAEELLWDGFRENASCYAQKYFTTTEPYCEKIFGNYKSLLAPESGRFDRFALTTEGVLFHFDRYDIFPGSMGIVSLTIPYAEMRAKLSVSPAEAEKLPESVTGKKMVALTFDDGPHPIHTNAILDVLEQHDARATFFDLGSLVEKYPDVVKREDALGCEVGSHSWDHKNFNNISQIVIQEDLAKTDAIFKKVLGHSPESFRPPYGNCNNSVKNMIPMPIYLWSVDTLDWKNRNADAIISEVKKLGDLDGRVILMHGIYSSTAAATAYLVPYLQEQGYELVTVSELVEAKHGEIPEKSKLYGYTYFCK